MAQPELNWTHLPNSRLIPRPEQQHHIITLAPAGPAWVRRRTYLFCAKLKGRSALPKHAARSASVPGIIQRASGCWLCLTFKLSSGDTMWNDSQKPAGAGRVLWLAPSFTSELGWKRKAGGEKRQKNAVSHFQFLFWQFCWLCAVLFSVVGLHEKKIPCCDCAYRLKAFLTFTYASELSFFSPWRLLCSPSLRPHTFQSPLPLKWFLISAVLQTEAAWDGIRTVYRCISWGFTGDIKKRMVKTEGIQAEVFWFSVPLGQATKTLDAT